mgnify:FL=1
MKILSVRFICRLKNNGLFSAYKGSMLRGALGVCLRRAVCMTQKSECFHCMLRATCVFPRLFTAASAPEGSGTAPLLPPPFCIEPAQDRQTEYAAGETFSFGLKLFSYATEYLPYFIHAFTLAGQRGMGRGTEHGQGKFLVEDVLLDGRSIYDARTERLHDIETRNLPLPTPCPADGNGLLPCRLVTPLRFKVENRLSATLDFTTLLHLIMRRIRSLYALDGETFRLPQEEFSTLLQTASTVTIAENALRWEDWSRYSGRQRTVMQLGGLTGRIVYQGPVAVFGEYLDFARMAHIGKQSSFGLGALELN